MTQLIEDGRGGWAVLGEAAVSGSAAGGKDDRNFDLVVGRLRHDGSPRKSFGRKGVKRLAVGRERGRPDYDFMVSGAIRRRWLILAATDEDGRPVVLRLNSNGRLDRRYARAWVVGGSSAPASRPRPLSMSAAEPGSPFPPVAALLYGDQRRPARSGD